MAVDALNITNYNLSSEQLEERIIFWILAAGKNGVTAANCLDRLLSSWQDVSTSPFEIIKEIDRKGILPNELKKFGIGCYSVKAEYFRCLISANLDLKTCTVDDLEAIKGIGPKTARCFLIHSRENQKYAGLDTHCLKFLRDKGHDVPKSTPNGKKYRELEKIFLQYVEESGMTVADFDLMIWKKYRGNNVANIR